MILDDLPQLINYAALHPRFADAVCFLARPDLSELPDGRLDISGETLYAVVMRAAGRPVDQAALEVHNRYIDIQVVLTGPETMGWKPRGTCQEPSAPYDAEKDLQFFDDRPDSWVQVNTGQFAIFYPADAHAPMVAEGRLHKIVIKVAC
ncbi:MAG: YhcH/YjgK/YiaL family protein [Lentisphaerae bacterium]|nr:YhcH/YjgK/YiaL family protein [Lentisphaerota bacterium]